MPTEVIKIGSEIDYWESVRRAARVLRDGGLVGFPTETVYGVGVRADDRRAVFALREAKQREESKPFTVHIGRPEDVNRFVPRLSGMSRRFVHKGWPGPLTLVFSVDDPASMPVIRETGPDRVDLMYHEGTVGIRCPDQETASALLSEAGVPVVAASANRAGRAPPRSAKGVIADLGDKVDLVLDGGRTRYAKPSTVVKLNGSGYEVLREGVIGARALKRLGSLNVLFVCSGNTCRSPMAAAMCRRAFAEKLGCREADLRKRDVQVFSAGAFGVSGSPASHGATRAMATRKIDLSEHVTRGLDAEIINQADYVFCMTRAQLDIVLGLVPSVKDRTALLAGAVEIEDPFGSSATVYDECAGKIQAALETRLAELQP